MNIPIIASSLVGIGDALIGMGYDGRFQSIIWNRSPVRIDGIWHAEVRHG